MKEIILFMVLSCHVFALDVKSGGRLSGAQEAMDVKHYLIDLRVDPYKETIGGEVVIKFELLRRTDFIEIDLLDKYTVSSTKIDGTSLAFTHEKNKLLIENPGIVLFVDHELLIRYGGKPPAAKNPPWSGGFTWSNDVEGRHWVGVSCQSNGAYVWYPCKEHPSDKPNGAEIIITTPKPLMAVSNGVLVSVENTIDRWSRWHWKTEYPISTYNINFTIGNFETIEKTGYVLDEPIDMVFYVLKEKMSGAVGLLEEAEEHLNFYARAFGQYPWKNEKFGLVHTPFSGMEHQTINAYGNNYEKTELGYDFILFHELGHEWWGNYLSVADWADFWIHEGVGTYAEAMYIEERFGLEKARAFIDDRFKKNITNSAPVVPQRNSTTKQKSGNDVYYKAAHFLHILRYLVGRDILWKTLNEFLYMPKELPMNQTSTDEFLSLINENTKKDLRWVFDQYLSSKELPILHMREKEKGNKRFIDLWWKNNGFKMPIEIEYDSFDGKRKKELKLTNKPMRIVVPLKSKLIIDPDRWLLYELMVIR